MNYILKEIDQKKFMNKKHKNGCAVKNYIQHLLILAFAFTRSVSISALASLVAIIIGIMSSTV